MLLIVRLLCPERILGVTTKQTKGFYHFGAQKKKTLSIQYSTIPAGGRQELSGFKKRATPDQRQLMWE